MNLDVNTAAADRLSRHDITPAELLCPGVANRIESNRADSEALRHEITVEHTDCTDSQHDVGQQATQQARAAGLLTTTTGLRFEVAVVRTGDNYKLDEISFIGGLFPDDQVLLSFNTWVAHGLRRNNYATATRAHVFKALESLYDSIWAKGTSVDGHGLLEDTGFIRVPSTHSLANNWYYRDRPVTEHDPCMVIQA